MGIGGGEGEGVGGDVGYQGLNGRRVERGDEEKFELKGNGSTNGIVVATQHETRD